MGALDACWGCCRGSKLPDFLDPHDREFYENSIAKWVMSIVCGAVALLFLGLTAVAGGVASSQQTMKSKAQDGDDNIYQTEIGGFGFSAFCYLTAFCLSVSAAVIISPVMTGSAGEVANMRSPGEFKFASRSALLR